MGLRRARAVVKRSRIELADVADYDNLAYAFWRAAQGKRQRADVRRFATRLPQQLSRLQSDILSLEVAVGEYQTFRIWDPKPRLIHAPCFRERVLHHALMAQLGPVLDRTLVDDTFACRAGKGTYVAVARAQEHIRRHPWYGKIDVRAYFASIEHDRLLATLARRIKGGRVLALCERVVRSHVADPLAGPAGRGLPIGALTSQHFANLYLDALDRFLLDRPEVRGLVRYMDDSVYFCDTRAETRAVLSAADAFVRDHLGLQLRDDRRIQRSAFGLPFLGFRVFPGTLRLSRRRMARYRAARRRWEQAYLAGDIDALGLQAGYAAALATTAHVDSAAFRREDLRRRPAPEA